VESCEGLAWGLATDLPASGNGGTLKPRQAHVISPRFQLGCGDVRCRREGARVGGQTSAQGSYALVNGRGNPPPHHRFRHHCHHWRTGKAPALTSGSTVQSDADRTRTTGRSQGSSKGYFYRNIAIVYVPFLYLDDLRFLSARQKPTVDRVLLFRLAFNDCRGAMSPAGQTFPNVSLDI